MRRPHAELLLLPTFVYVAGDIDRLTLYVGVTVDLERRTAAHRTQSPWWSEVRHLESEVFADRLGALDRERSLIDELGPRYNRDNPQHWYIRDLRVGELRGQGLTIEEIAAATGSGKGSVTRAVRRLRQRGILPPRGLGLTGEPVFTAGPPCHACGQPTRSPTATR